jgi:hypothetical protein
MVASSQIAYPIEPGKIALPVPGSLFQLRELFIGHLVVVELVRHRWPSSEAAELAPPR